MPVFSARPASTPTDRELEAAGVPDTSPTWELELLISGAVLFALFQLPAVLDSFFGSLRPHVTSGTGPALFLVELYVRAIVYALIASFVVHLVSRAYWVGLVGLQSVFPRGVQWEELKAGPITLDVYRKRFSGLPAVISRTDNFCSVIFSFAFLLVILFAFTIVVSGVMGALAYGAAWLFFGGRNVRHFFLAFAALLAIVPLVANVVDRRFGPRLPPDGRSARMLRATANVLYRISLLNVTGPIFLTLLTNIGRRRLMAIFYAAFLGIILFVAADRLQRTGRLSLNSYDYYAQSAGHGVNYRFYESQREPDEILDRVPSIQSDVIRDPYLKLFIPYSPARHNALVAKECPAVHALQERGVQFGLDRPVADSVVVPALRCLARIHAVTLNGAPRPDLEFSFYEHPRTGLKGIIAYIPTDSLPHGRNVLTIRAAPVIGDDAPKTPLPPWVIPFWK